MKKNNPNPKRAEDFSNLSVTQKYDTIKLGIDWHAREYRVVRVIDGNGPEPAQRFMPEKFFAWLEKQKRMARRVCSCYEAGSGGFSLHRRLQQMGVENYVIAPQKLDPDHRNVRNDKTEARVLALNLDRFVAGNPKAMKPIFIPTVEQERRRLRVRQRDQLRRDRLAHATQGRMLLLSQGYAETNKWWHEPRWKLLENHLPKWLVEQLKIYRQLILATDELLKQLTQQAVQASAQKERPVGMGSLTLEQIESEVCDFKRFTNRKAPGSFIGLVGGVSSSGASHRDLPINKAGHARLRAILIELAWRWVRHQKSSRLVQKWKLILCNPHAHARKRKRAIVALARELFVEICRWKNGQATPQELGWAMVAGQSPCQEKAG